METQNWLLKQAATQPNQIAIDDGNERLSFAELKKQVEVMVAESLQNSFRLTSRPRSIHDAGYPV